jgi:hypothetical protein
LKAGRICVILGEKDKFQEEFSMKPESLKAIKDAYIIERDCINEMMDYIDDEQFAKAVELLSKCPPHRYLRLRPFRHHLPAYGPSDVLH